MSAPLAKTLRSSTFRRALFYIFVFGAVVLALLGFAYRSTVNYLRRHADQGLMLEIAALKDGCETSGSRCLIDAVARRASVSQKYGAVYLLAEPSLAVLAGSLPNWPSAAKESIGWVDFTEDDRRTPVRALVVALPDDRRLLVGKVLDDFRDFESDIRLAVTLTVLLVFVLAGVSSVTITRRTVGRIEGINATCRLILKSGLGQRISERGTGDEWDELAANLNEMLDRIETLMGEVKQVTDNVAHNLRTPLARMRIRVEKAEERRREVDLDPSLLSDILADLDEVLRMFSSLMRISQIEAYDRRVPLHPVNLFEITTEVAELFDAAAEDRGVALTHAGDEQAIIMGERDLLFDLLSNLVDNALKYGGAAGKVSVDVRMRESGAMVSVSDGGPGIPPSETQNVCKRFYRLDRDRAAPGNGLGLSIVSAVARLHGAQVEMLDNAPGLTVRICFPRRAAIEGGATAAR